MFKAINLHDNTIRKKYCVRHERMSLLYLHLLSPPLSLSLALFDLHTQTHVSCTLSWFSRYLQNTYIYDLHWTEYLHSINEAMLEQMLYTYDQVPPGHVISSTWRFCIYIAMYRPRVLLIHFGRQFYRLNIPQYINMSHFV